MIRALFGGSFDPVHNGHLAVVRHLLAHGLADHVVVVPAALSPFKDGMTAPAEQRLAMARLAFGDESAVSVDDREVRRGGTSFTIDTLRSLAQEHPDDRWRLVIGADNAAGLARWREAAALADLAEVVVMPRGGADPAPAQGLGGARFLLVEDFDEPVSSTAIRAMLARGAVPDADLPPAVARHIRRCGLYGILGS